MRRDHRGFSMIELVVVIAIMAILSTVGVLSYGMVSGRQVISCAEEIESYLGQTKTQALSRASADLEIFIGDDGVYVNPSIENRDIKVGKSGITVKYQTDDGTEFTLSDTERLVISFDRSSGAFQALADGSYCKSITLDNGRHSRKIVLIPSTGKFYIEE